MTDRAKLTKDAAARVQELVEVRNRGLTLMAYEEELIALASLVASLEQERDIAKEQHANTLNRLLDTRAKLAERDEALEQINKEATDAGKFDSRFIGLAAIARAALAVRGGGE